MESHVWVIIVDEPELIREAYRKAWRYRLDKVAEYLFLDHPDLDSNQDSMLLTEEDLNELHWLDSEIGIEHVTGRHRDGCPTGCMYRER